MAMISSTRIRNTAYMISQGKRTSGEQCLFKRLPYFIQVEICTYSSDPAVHKWEEAIDIAEAVLCRKIKDGIPERKKERTLARI